MSEENRGEEKGKEEGPEEIRGATEIFNHKDKARTPLPLFRVLIERQRMP